MYIYIKEYAAGTVPANKEYAAGTSQMSVGAGWPMAMPLGAGVLRWVLACRSIEKKTESLVYTPPSTCVYVLTIHREFLAVAHFLP